MSLLHRGFHLERLQSQEQSTTGWLTPSDDLTQCDANLLFFFFLLCFFNCKQKTKCCVVMAAGSGLKNLQCSDTKCWGQGHQCGSKNIILFEEPAYDRESKRDTHTERERGTKNISIQEMQQLQIITTNLY